MKIVNNKITINKGETPTYNVAVIDKDTGAPFRLPVLPDGKDRTWIVEFIVRPSIYNRDDDYVFKALLLRKDKEFTTDKIETYHKNSDNEPLWDSQYDFNAHGQQDTRDALFRGEIVLGSGVWEYRYFENGEWKPYEFRINFMFPYEYTSKMEAKTYKYEIVLFGGVPNKSVSNNVLYGETLPIDIEYKKFLLESMDFEVGGSLSE
jgi:hypothetical protein